MRDQLAETLVGAAVLAVAAVFLVYSFGASGRDTGRGYDVTARFATVDGLSVGMDVRMSGVKVGSVSGIDLNPLTYQVDVTLTLRDDVPIPADSTIATRTDGLLGGLSVAISPGAEEVYMADGDRFAGLGQGPIDVVRLLAEFVASSAD